MAVTNSSFFLVGAIGNNLLDEGIEATFSGPIITALFGNQDADVLNAIANLTADLNAWATNIAEEGADLDLVGDTSTIKTYWDMIINSTQFADAQNQSPPQSLAQFLTSINTANPIFGSVALTDVEAVATAANDIIAVLSDTDTDTNYIQLFFNNRVQGLQLYGSAPFVEGGVAVPNAGAIQTFAAFLSPFTITILKACTILEVFTAQGNPNSLAAEEGVQTSLNTFAGTFIPSIAGGIANI